MNKIRLATAGMAALLWVGSPALAQKSTSHANRTTADVNWMKKAAQGGVAEVELGNLAQQKASSQAVKDFAARMVTDHTKANDELKQIAQKQNVTLPDAPGAKENAEKNRLSSLSGEQFDRAYMQHMVMDHKKDLAEFKHEARSGSDPDVKAFASKLVPTLEEHLKLAEQTTTTAKSTK